MLFQEITPFATAHRAKLDSIIETLESLDPDLQTVTISGEIAAQWANDLRNTKRAFDRFEVCAKDEWKQKERYQDTAQHCRLFHKDHPKQR